MLCQRLYISSAAHRQCGAMSGQSEFEIDSVDVAILFELAREQPLTAYEIAKRVYGTQDREELKKLWITITRKLSRLERYGIVDHVEDGRKRLYFLKPDGFTCINGVVLQPYREAVAGREVLGTKIFRCPYSNECDGTRCRLVEELSNSRAETNNI